MFHKLIYIVNTLFNIVLLLSNGIKFNEFAYLRPPIHLFYSNSFSPLFIYFYFLERGSLTDFFYNIHKSNFLFQVTRFYVFDLRKNERGEIASLMK